MTKDPICGMIVNENAALKLASGGKTYFFCSVHCLKKFAEEKRIAQKIVASCLAHPKAPFYRNKTFIVSSALLILVLLSYLMPLLVPFRESFFMYFKTIWWAILLGFFIGGVIDYFIPREYVSYTLANPKKRTIFYSVILGFFMSACSHGILALSIELHKKGASNPAVVAFLLASPWANMTLTIMLIGFFGLKAFFIIISAIVIAIITGLIFQILEKRNLIEKNENIVEIKEDFSVKEDIKKRFKEYKLSLQTFRADIKGIYNGMVSLGNMVLWWILIGMAIASFAGAYIPAYIFSNYMGPTILGLIVTLILATIIEVCSEGSAPMAFEIFRQTGALGNSFVFLMAGVVTDYTEIGLLWHNVGRKTAIWLPIIAVPQVILLGIIANIIFK
ncbi:MAG: permease [Candidatus Omnitrophica bacterium]|nr:permease [Candidatus Omnitrophota bacterium]